jgi:hypothetical protein
MKQCDSQLDVIRMVLECEVEKRNENNNENMGPFEITYF